MVRLAHFTDLHVTEIPAAIPWRVLLGKRFLGWLNLTLRGRALHFGDAARVAQALIRDLMDQEWSDYIVSTGDLTGLSLASEFTAARQAMEPLFIYPNVAGIPGNHDVYVPGAVRRRLYDQTFGAWARSDFSAAELPPQAQHLHPYPVVRLLGDEAALVCLRDVRPTLPWDSSGRVGEAQLAALTAVLASPRLEGRFKILALHYGLCRADRSADTRSHGLRDAREVIRIASQSGVGLVLHGHLHARFLLPPAPGWPFVIANPGSVSSRKPGHERAYHVITIAGGRLRIEARRYDAGSGAFVAWPEADFEQVIEAATPPGSR